MLPLGAMSGYVILMQIGTVRMSEAHVTTKGNANVPGLGCCLRSCFLLEHNAELALTLSGHLGVGELLYPRLPGQHSILVAGCR